MQILDRLTLVIAGAVRKGASVPVCFSARDRTYGNLGNASTLAPISVEEIPASLISVDGISASLDVRTCLCSSGTVTASIPVDAHSRVSNRPIAELLGVFDPECLPASEQLELALSMAAGDTTINILQAPGLTYPSNGDIVHCGVEAIQLTSAGVDVGGVYYGYSCTRGVAGTLPAPHSVSQTTGNRPSVTFVPSVWLGRVVWLCLDGAIWRRGLLSAIPSISENTITLEFVLEDNRVSETPSTIDSIPTVGFYDKHITTTEEWYGMLLRRVEPRYVSCQTTGTPGEFLVKYTDDLTALQSELAPQTYDNRKQYLIGTQGAQGSPQNPACRPYITGGKVGIVQCLMGSYLYVSDRSGNLLNTTTSAGLDVTVKISPWSRLYCSLLPVGSVLNNADGLEQYAWLPTLSYTRANDVLVYEPLLGGVTLTQLPGRALYLQSLATGGPALQIGMCSTEMLPASEAYLQDRDDDYRNVSQLVTPPTTGIRPLTARCSLGRTGSTTEGLVPKASNLDALGGCNWPGWLCRYPVRCATDKTAQFDTMLGFNRVDISWLEIEPSEYIRIPVVCALQWWENGFSDIRLDDIPLGDTTYPCLRATWYEPDGEERWCDLALEDNYDAQGGYNYKVKRFLPSRKPTLAAGIGNWPGQPKAVFRPICGQANVTGGYALATLLASIDSTSGLTILDKLPAGLSATIESASFHAIADPAGVSGWSWSVGDSDKDVTAQDFISSVLVMTRSVIVGVPSHGYRLERVSIGNPTRRQIGESAAEGALITDDIIIGQPTSDTDREVVTAYEMSLPEGNKITWIDQDAIQRYGEGSSLRLDLTQALTDGYGALELVNIMRGTLGSLCETYGRARRIWRVSVPIEKCAMWYVGQAVAVTSKYLYGYSSERGIDAAPATITDIELMPMEGKAELTLWARKQIGGAYDIGCLVYYNSNYNLYTVPLAVSPDGVTHDASFFQAGDEVVVNMLASGSTVAKITSITTGGSYDTITLDTAIGTQSAAVATSPQGLVELSQSNARPIPYFLVGVDCFC